jgi:hypothetical protein
MIILFNMYMHAVDVFDQARKLFGCDLGNGIRKWTVRAFEILFSMRLSQANSIHRAVHKNNPNKRSSRLPLIRAY